MFMNFNSTDSILVQDLSGILSPTFINKKSDDVLSIYKIDNCFNLSSNSSPEEIVKNLSNDMNCSPDGWLVYISDKYQEKIKQLIRKEFLKAFKNDALNFDNGERSETILYHIVRDGMIIELVDPECGSEFFYDLIDKINEFMENNNVDDFLSFELCHMPTHVHDLNDYEDGEKFLSILEKKNINYYKYE